MDEFTLCNMFTYFLVHLSDASPNLAKMNRTRILKAENGSKQMGPINQQGQLKGVPIKQAPTVFIFSVIDCVTQLS